MYEQHFHLRQAPFSIAPDPSFLYLSSSHREAMAHLRYGLTNGGFVLITGEVGTGKTTLLRNLLQHTPPDLDVAFILNPRLTVRELLESLCDELGISYDRSTTDTVKQYIDVLNRHLLHTHQSRRGTVVIIDEAQNLSPAVLEQVRLLTNLETDERKLLRIILLGQPELAELLARQELRQLAQRITARYHLGALNRDDTRAYVRHRLSHVGGNPDLFTPAALRRLYRRSGGIPRLINAIADRALLGAYAQDRQRVTAGIVSRAAAEVLGRSADRYPWVIAAAATVVIASSIGAYLWLQQPALHSSPTAAISEPVPAKTTNLPLETVEHVTSPPAPDASVSVSDAASSIRSTAIEAPVSEGIVVDPPPMLPAEQLAPPPELVETVQQTDEITRPTGNTYQVRRQAYSAVFERWGIDFDSAPDGQIPCDFAPSAGLQCLSGRGDWSEIERLDLPVVLELWDETDAPFHAALTAMEQAQITLHLGGEDLQTTQRALRDVWYGAYVVLWRTPPGYSGSLRNGDSHETVAWLRRQLEELGLDTQTTGAAEYFDTRLQETVTSFQQQEGLLTDGIVGPATWIRLANRLHLSAPSLRS